MPILYESTDEAIRQSRERLRLSPSPGIGTDTLIFVAGVFTGMVVMPIVLPIAGYQLIKRWGPPPPRGR